MAIIVEFPTRAHRQCESALVAKNSAEIVLFPGIRYEYWDEKPAATAKVSRRKAKRDLLEVEG